MKKHLLTCIFAAPLLLFAQQTYTWNTYNGSWTDPGNWSPQRNAPAADDVLVFSVNAEITEIPSAESIGKLWITNNATLSINSTSPGTLTIGHTAIASPHFLIEAGSALKLSGNNAIELVVDESFSGEVFGNIDFFDGHHRLIVLSSGGVQFMAGSTFTANTGMDGSPFGTTSLNSILFESGAHYINKAGGTPFGATAPKTVVIFKTGSIYTYNRNGVGSSLAGRTFGHLCIKGNVNFAGFGSAKDCIIQNDFRLITGYFLYKPNSGGTHIGNFNIYGDIICEDTTYLDIGSENMSGAVQLLGIHQSLGSGGGTGTITIKNLTVNNTLTELNRHITVTDTLNLMHGIIRSSPSSLLTLAPTSQITSCLHDYSNLNYTHIGCDNSYIEGPVQKSDLNNEDFPFPVGLHGKLRPIFLRNATGSFTVTYQSSDPYLNLGSATGDGIHHISHMEYWNIEGAGTAKVELSFYDPNSGGVTDMDALRIARYNEVYWEETTVSSTKGTPGSNGSVTSISLNQFGHFTLAGSKDYPNNPLPIEIIEWKAIENGGEVMLLWQMNNSASLTGFIIEKKSGQKGFEPITQVIPANPTPGHFPTFSDVQPYPGRNQYRLRVIDREGKIFYSAVIQMHLNDNQYIKAYPNPAREKIYIKIPPSSSISDWLIVNIEGKVVKRLNNNNSQTNVCVDISNLSPGLYYIKGVQKQTLLNIPFIKVNY